MVGDGAVLRLSVGLQELGIKGEGLRVSTAGLSSLASIKSATHSKSFLVVFYSTTENVYINYHIRGRGKGTCADTGNKQ